MRESRESIMRKKRLERAQDSEFKKFYVDGWWLLITITLSILRSFEHRVWQMMLMLLISDIHFLSLKGKSIDIWSWLFPIVRLNHIKSDRQVSLGLNRTWTWRMMTFSIQSFELLSWKICLIRKLLNRNQGLGLF